jgi:hypothetical protein
MTSRTVGDAGETIMGSPPKSAARRLEPSCSQAAISLQAPPIRQLAGSAFSGALTALRHQPRIGRGA